MFTKLIAKINLFNTAYIALIIICLISFWGAVVYRLYSLNNIGITISLALAIISFISLIIIKNKYNIKKNDKSEINNPGPANSNILSFFLPLIYLLFVAICFYILISHQTDKAIISPWQVLPDYFFVFYCLATIVLFFLISKINKFYLPFIIIHYFLSFSIAIITYKIGYGFDPFIHQATMKLIDKNGIVDPKPFYYLGQYGLIVITHKITSLPIPWLDKFLVPMLASIYLPLFQYKFFANWLHNKKQIALASLVMLIFPFSFFILSTPQNFSYLLLLLAIIAGLCLNNIFDLVLIYLLSLTALAVQPIAGIPALFYAFFLTLHHSSIKQPLKKYLNSLIALLMIATLPLIFYFLGNNTFNSGQNSLNNLKSIFLAFFLKFKPSLPSQENIFLNFTYFYFFSECLIFIFLIIYGIFLFLKYKKECKIFAINILISALLLTSYFLTKIIPFNFLIDYERDNFSDRILAIAFLFVLPLLFLTFYSFIEKIKNKNLIIKIIFIFFISIIITISLYLSYPRFDNYFNSRGYSTSGNDFKAVNFIAQNANKYDYIVLANQQVSSAALAEFGFKKYYRQDIFYYPIPTGGPLYQYYLDMVYERPARATMIKAMESAGVNEGYFVLNKYWWAFPKILEEAKLEADDYWEIADGEIFIFKYNK